MYEKKKRNQEQSSIYTPRFDYAGNLFVQPLIRNMYN